jgi:autotransporter strand-loop-strand O-heptosyltransferase
MFKYKLVQIEGLYFELVETPKEIEYLVKFVHYQNNEKILLYESNLKKGMWSKINLTYLLDYYIEIWEGEKLREEISFIEHLKDKRVFICFDSNSLGDTLAWMPYLIHFKNKYRCSVIVSTFKNDLFKGVYPEIKFAGRGEVVHDIHAQYKIGWFYDKKQEPVHPATISLQKACTNILNLEYKEIKPRLDFVRQARPIEGKYVCISIHSTAQLKLWNYWQDVIDYLNDKGYSVVEVSKEEVNLNNVIKLQDTSMSNTMNYLYHCDFIVGLSSGISWLGWALNKYVIMIANFTEDGHEFKDGCIRITNKSVCNSCWNNPKYKFNKGDWYWCPEHEHTERAFECHSSISPEMVIDSIKELEAQL